MLVSTSGAALALPMAVVERVVELPETFSQVGGAPVLKDQGRPLPVRSLAGALGYEAGVGTRRHRHQRPAALHPGGGSGRRHGRPGDQADDRADRQGMTGTARSAEGELVLVVGLSFLMDGCRDAARLAA